MFLYCVKSVRGYLFLDVGAVYLVDIIGCMGYSTFVCVKLARVCGIFSRSVDVV